MLTEDAKEIEELIFKREAMGNVVIPNTHIALIHTRSGYFSCDVSKESRKQ
jgi:mannitol operon transcriptional antiterminator